MLSSILMVRTSEEMVCIRINTRHLMIKLAEIMPVMALEVFVYMRIANWALE